MNATYSVRRQAGWTVWGLIAVMALAGFFALLFLKLFPPYHDNYKLNKALQTVAAEPRIAVGGRRAIISKLDKILYLDYAHKVVDLNDTLRIEKKNDRMILTINYEVVVPLAYNISALLEFNNQAEISLR